MLFTSAAAAIIAKNNGDTNSKSMTLRQKVALGIILAIELIILAWALVLAWNCGGRHEDRFVHLMAAVFSPVIYILYYFIAMCGEYKCVPHSP